MPKVGNKKYSYDSKGKAAAKKESRRTGKAMINVHANIGQTRAKRGAKKK
jgi:hypothetical protein